MNYYKEISQAQFHQKMIKKSNENFSLLKSVNNYIKNKRGYVNSLPNEGEAVVLLLSGGVDSIIAWYILLKYLRCHVYPICVKRNFFDPQVFSVKHYYKLFEAQFKKNCERPLIVGKNNPMNFFRDKINSKIVSENYILEHFYPNDKFITLPQFSGSSVLSVWSAFFYLQFLRLVEKQKISKIYCGFLSTDGDTIRSQTVSYTRLTNLMLMEFYNDKTIELQSVFIDDIKRIYMNKEDAVKLARRNEIQLSHSFSCDQTKLLHCGICPSCNYRREIFKKASIKDETLYWSDYGSFLKLKAIVLLTRNLLFSRIKRERS